MKILVVDDSRAMRMLIMRAFRQSGYREHTFVEAASGPEALSLMDESVPDLVLLDVNMAELSGIEVAKQMRVSQPKVPFGFITSESDPEILQRCLDSGARFILAKPFDSDQLKTAVGALIR